MSDNGTAYCIRCGKKTEYSIKLQRVRVNVCGVRFSYIEKAPLLHELWRKRLHLGSRRSEC